MLLKTIKSLRGFISILLAIVLSISINAYPEAEAKKFNLLRVCIEKDKPHLTLKIKGSFTIETLHTREILQHSKETLKTQIVSPTNSGMKIGEKEFTVYAIRIIPTVSANVYINERRFRGIMDIIRTEEMKLLAINHVDVEDYLYGVLYYETPHYWPIETLMAQAVAARTYALYKKIEMKDFDYDLTSDTYSQVYGGKKGERWRTQWAVNRTKGKVLTYQGEIFPTYYHSICGGHTEDAYNIWKQDYLPLKGRGCDYCMHAPGYHWKAMFSYKQMEERLSAYGIKCSNITFIMEGERNKSSRLESVRIKDKDGIKGIPSYRFRLALGTTVIRSTNFTIELTPKGIIFRGVGWGHGVGMCQWGAFAMARKGFDYEKILAFYYPESKVTNL